LLTQVGVPETDLKPARFHYQFGRIVRRFSLARISLHRVLASGWQH